MKKSGENGMNMSAVGEEGTAIKCFQYISPTEVNDRKGKDHRMGQLLI